MSNNQNRPRPNNQGQQKIVDTEPGVLPVSDIPTPDAADIVPINMSEAHEADELVRVKAELHEANRRLANVQSALNNDYWTVGYLTNIAPIQRAIEGKEL